MPALYDAARHHRRQRRVVRRVAAPERQRHRFAGGEHLGERRIRLDRRAVCGKHIVARLDARVFCRAAHRVIRINIGERGYNNTVGKQLDAEYIAAKLHRLALRRRRRAAENRRRAHVLRTVFLREIQIEDAADREHQHGRRADRRRKGADALRRRDGAALFPHAVLRFTFILQSVFIPFLFSEKLRAFPCPYRSTGDEKYLRKLKTPLHNGYRSDAQRRLLLVCRTAGLQRRQRTVLKIGGKFQIGIRPFPGGWHSGS
jgi:hypothetical protein